MNKLYIDVSHILGWQGRLTGIERVEYHLIRYYFKQGSEKATFVAWDPSISDFIELSEEEVNKAVIERISNPISQKKETTASRLITKRIIKRLERQLVKLKRENSTKDLKPKQMKGGNLLVLAGLWDKQDYINTLTNLHHDGVNLFHIVYDTIPILQPQYMVDFLPPIFENYMLKILPICQGILCISESTASDTKKVLDDNKVNVPPILAFRLGDDLPADITERKPNGVNKDFFLTVSTIESRKNHMIFYYLYKLAKQRSIDLPDLYIVGKRGWNTSDLQYLIEHDPEVQNSIKILDNIEDGELSWLYKNAKLVIFPSYYEGWGLPVAEALYYNKIVLCSNTSSLPEVGGRLADYFSPFSPEELLVKVENYLSNPAHISKKEQLIRDTYKPVSWHQAAEDFDKKLSSLT